MHDIVKMEIIAFGYGMYSSPIETNKYISNPVASNYVDYASGSFHPGLEQPVRFCF